MGWHDYGNSINVVLVSDGRQPRKAPEAKRPGYVSHGNLRFILQSPTGELLSYYGISDARSVGGEVDLIIGKDDCPSQHYPLIHYVLMERL